MATTIITKFGSGAPAASDVVRGELAVDTENGRLYTENIAGSVVEIGLNPSGNLDVTGTVTADGLTVDGNATIGQATAATNRELFINGVASKASRIAFQESGTNRWLIGNGAASENGNFEIYDATNGNNFVITRTGNVGIGTSSPTFGLSVESDNGSGYAALFRKSSSDPALTIQTTSSITQIQGLNSALSATNDIAMQLSGGNVGIGTASPVSPLTTSIGAGSAGSLNNQIAMTHSGASNSYHIKTIRATANDEPAGLAFVENTTERMRIDSSGNVGIGVVPGVKLHVEGDTDSNVMIVNNIGTAPNYIFDVRDDGVVKFRVDPSGNVGIGTDSPGRNLEIAGTGTDVGLNITKNTVGTVRFAYDSTGPYILDEDSNPFRVYTGGSERIRIDSTGRVGIGRTPSISSSKLEVGGADNVSLINVEASGVTGGMGIGSTGLQFFHGSSAKMRIDSSGRLLVSETTNIGTRFVIEAGNSGSGEGALIGLLTTGRSGSGYPIVGYNCEPTTTALTYNRHSNDYASWVDFLTGQVRTFTTTAVGTGTTTGTAGPYVAGGGTSWTSSSDQRFKDNVQGITYGLDAVKSLNPVSYVRNDRDTGETELGFIAQEVESVVQEVVNVDPDGYYGLNYERLIPVLTKAIQEQQDLIESLTARIAALEGAN